MTDTTSLPELWVVIGSVYVVAGAFIALRLSRTGVSRSASLAALGCWPLMLPLLGGPSVPTRTGPLAHRITQCSRDLRASVADPAATDVLLVDDLDELVVDLQRADERLGMVDALLADVGQSTAAAPALETLRRARARAASEVEAVLDGMVELRVSIGLRSLAGNTVPVQERLVDLRARLGALDEIAALDLERHP